MEDLTGRTALLVLCIITLGAVTTLPSAEGSPPERPKLETTWKATYNATGTVTQACGKYYASYFLQKFLKTQDALSQLCGNTTSISIASVARVRIYHYQACRKCKDNCGSQKNCPKPRADKDSNCTANDAQIQLSTFLNFAGPSKGSVMQCVSKLNDTLQNIHTLADVSIIGESMPLNCTKATMATDVLGWDEEGCRWACQEGWTLIGQSTMCEMKMPRSEQLGRCQNSSTRCDRFTECFLTAKEAVYIDCTNVEKAFNCTKEHMAAHPDLYATCWGEVEEVITFVLNRIDCSHLVTLESMKPDKLCTTTSTTTVTTTPTTTSPTTTTTTTTTPTTPTTTTTVTNPTTITTNGLTTAQPPMDWHVNFTDMTNITIKNGKHTLRLYEGETKNVTFNIWANVTSVCGGADNCTLYIQVSFETNPRVNCSSTGEAIDQVVVVGPPISSGNTTNNDNFCKIEFFTRKKFVPALNKPAQVTFSLRGCSDFTYDNSTVGMTLSLKRESHNQTFMESRHSALNIEVVDMDRKATCQSINDPHITTFDGLAYDNLYHGEFKWYSHKTLPFQVNIIYQHCSEHVNASCNCAIAIKSGDDVIVFNRCFLRKKPFLNLNNTLAMNTKTLLMVDLYLNGELTPGTRIHEADEGLKYFVYLPTGTYIKIKTSGELLNAWILGSPTDWKKTEGLCGMYNADPQDDLIMPNGTVLPTPKDGPPRSFIKAWNVALYSEDSLLLGTKASDMEEDYHPEESAVCSDDSPSNSAPSRNRDIEMCKILEGKDVTDFYVKRAVNSKTTQPEKYRRRRRREIPNTINAVPPKEPIDISKGFVPPVYTWPSMAAEANATKYCNNYIRTSVVGMLCAMISNVNFEQEVTTCIGDVQITNTTNWADSAEDAMKEQCLEELKRNSSIDPSLVAKIHNAICPNKCTSRGTCTKGKCVCDSGFTGVDCAASLTDPPDAAEMKNLGLCDTKINDCSRVIVYGDNFIPSPQLVCLLTETILAYNWYTLGDDSIWNATFINFNAVECPIPKLQPYVISVSNNNGSTKSEPLLFIPYNGNCLQCSTSKKECNQTANTCVIKNQCYTALEIQSEDKCNVCRPDNNKRGWSAVPDCELSDAVVIAIAAIVGSLVGIAIGILLYIICCRRSSRQKPMDDYSSRSGRNGFKPTLRPVSDDRLHRNRELHPSQFLQSLDSRHRDYREPYMQNYGQGVENGVDDTTYF